MFGKWWSSLWFILKAPQLIVEGYKQVGPEVSGWVVMLIGGSHGRIYLPYRLERAIWSLLHPKTRSEKSKTARSISCPFIKLWKMFVPIKLQSTINSLLILSWLRDWRWNTSSQDLKWGILTLMTPSQYECWRTCLGRTYLSYDQEYKKRLRGASKHVWSIRIHH